MKKAIVVLLVAGCSTASKDIEPVAVPSGKFAGYDCEQIANEQARIQRRVVNLGGRLDQAAATDQGIGVVGVVVFWPALFFLGGTKEQEDEYARLKGDYNALHAVAMEKTCSAPVNGVVPAPAQ